MPSPTVHVTVISGFLGAGKTTLLDRLLADTEGPRVGVVAGDPSAAGFARARGAAVRLARPRLVEMHGGRLCSSLREDVRQELCGLATHPRDDRNVSFVYRARRPFHPARFHRFLFEEWDGVLRSKGFFWLATRPDLAGYWSHTGSACAAQAFSPWWAAAPASVWPIDKAGLARIESAWDERLGDRRQELVFIGRGMDEGGLRHGLDRCLLSKAELSLGASGWAGFHDPFPSWTGRVPAEAPDRVPRCIQ